MNKYDLLKEDAVLFVIDIQEKLVPAMKYGEQVIRNANTLIHIAKKLGIPIIVTEQYPKGLGKIVSELGNNLDGSLVYDKVTFTGCTREVTSALKDLERKKIIITGMETHVCVFQTVRDLLSLGYQIFVVGDAICSRTKENWMNVDSSYKCNKSNQRCIKDFRRCLKIQFFSWPSIYLVLHKLNKLVII